MRREITEFIKSLEDWRDLLGGEVEFKVPVRSTLFPHIKEESMKTKDFYKAVVVALTDIAYGKGDIEGDVALLRRKVADLEKQTRELEKKAEKLESKVRSTDEDVYFMLNHPLGVIPPFDRGYELLKTIYEGIKGPEVVFLVTDDLKKRIKAFIDRVESD